MKPLISIVTACFNEGENVEELVERIRSVMSLEKKYSYEHIVIDNASTDDTVEKLRALARKDKHIKVIVNARNFGHIRSPYHAILQSTGDATISMASDLQDPPELIHTYLRKWEEGFKVVMAVKTSSQEAKSMFLIRKIYYWFIDKISEVPQVHNATGTGIYDKVVIDALRGIKDPYPYFRGLISELGFRSTQIPFDQPRRSRGVSANNFMSLYDMAMLAVTKHSKLPLRFLTIVGFIVALLSLCVSLGFVVAKLLMWNSFDAGIAPIMVGVFFFGAMQMLFIGILGEYVSSILTQTRNLPLVIEEERINF
jgi:glycosyltransferase involved in cell wall biosynthesis